MKSYETNDDPSVVALNALKWIFLDENRAVRFLSLTGLTPHDLKDRLSEPSVLVAVLAFLEAHEPDLIACAESLGVPVTALVDARKRLEG